MNTWENHLTEYWEMVFFPLNYKPASSHRRVKDRVGPVKQSSADLQQAKRRRVLCAVRWAIEGYENKT